jgi:hypothetical protein
LSDDSPVKRFRKRRPAPPEESDTIIFCDEAAELRETWARNAAAEAARARLAERERQTRLWSVEISRPELRVVEGPGPANS